MNKTSSSSDSVRSLRERLEARIRSERKLRESYRRKTEELLKSELEKLVASWRRFVRSGLRTIERDIERDLTTTRRRLAWLTLRGWRRPAAALLLAALWLLGWSWMLSWRLAGEVEVQALAKARLEVAVEALEERTWGVRLIEREGERWVQLPEGTRSEGGEPVSGWLRLPPR